MNQQPTLQPFVVGEEHFVLEAPFACPFRQNILYLYTKADQRAGSSKVEFTILLFSGTEPCIPFTIPAPLFPDCKQAMHNTGHTALTAGPHRKMAYSKEES